MMAGEFTFRFFSVFNLTYIYLKFRKQFQIIVKKIRNGLTIKNDMLNHNFSFIIIKIIDQCINKTSKSRYPP